MDKERRRCFYGKRKKLSQGRRNFRAGRPLASVPMPEKGTFIGKGRADE